MKTVVIIGGGIAGMEAASQLASLGYAVTLIEKQENLGGHVANWGRLFPTQRQGSEVLAFLQQGLNGKTEIRTSTSVTQITRQGDQFLVTTSTGAPVAADALLVTTGYETFDARKKEEYGYGIYENVLTSVDLERKLSRNEPILRHDGQVPKRVAFIHCVGSRDEKVNNRHCSKVCCVTAVKQAIELKQRIPGVEVFNFYMDLRMFGMTFEELYKEAQEKYGVTFIRGRLSEAAEQLDGSLLLKAEDTLVGRPIKLTVDLAILMVGFIPSKGTTEIASLLGIRLGSAGFVRSAEEHAFTNSTSVPGVFVAGSASAPRTITNTLTDARAAALKVASFLEKLPIEKRTLSGL